jgi:hypothetical protein
MGCRARSDCAEPRSDAYRGRRAAPGCAEARGVPGGPRCCTPPDKPPCTHRPGRFDMPQAIYIINAAGDLNWYWHTGQTTGTFTWAARSGSRVAGTGDRPRSSTHSPARGESSTSSTRPTTSTGTATSARRTGPSHGREDPDRLQLGLQARVLWRKRGDLRDRLRRSPPVVPAPGRAGRRSHVGSATSTSTASSLRSSASCE